MRSQRATAPHIASIRFDFEANQKIFQKYTNIEKVLKSQLITAVDLAFIQSLRNKYISYANNITKFLLDYLYTFYAKNTPSSLEANDKSIREALDPAQP